MRVKNMGMSMDIGTDGDDKGIDSIHGVCDDMDLDYIILECGIGGTYDSTNFLPKTRASVITSISYDHMDMLGRLWYIKIHFHRRIHIHYAYIHLPYTIQAMASKTLR
ncbi:hypothetical protein EON63_11425 [archaeon]|nr:MAG: hypothetical protein EON63_11425 [archaeon]